MKTIFVVKKHDISNLKQEKAIFTLYRYRYHTGGLDSKLSKYFFLNLKDGQIVRIII